MLGLGNDRERNAVLDEDKRWQVLSALSDRLDRICALPPPSDSKNSSSHGKGTGTTDPTSYDDYFCEQPAAGESGNDSGSKSKSNISSGDQGWTERALRLRDHLRRVKEQGRVALELEENTFYTRRGVLSGDDLDPLPPSPASSSATDKGGDGSCDGNAGGSSSAARVRQQAIVEKLDAAGQASLRAVFDGPARHAVHFKVKFPCSRATGRNWTAVNLSKEQKLAESAGWAQDYLIPTTDSALKESGVSSAGMARVGAGVAALTVGDTNKRRDASDGEGKNEGENKNDFF